MHKKCLALLILAAAPAWCQADGTRPVPRINRIMLRENDIPVLHLAAGFTTSVRLPDDVTSVVLGNPSAFKAEHADGEPRMVFFKPLIAQRAITNALITTRSGQLISLELVSDAGNSRQVDFLLDCVVRPGSVWDQGQRSSLVPDTRTLGEEHAQASAHATPEPDLAQELARQSGIRSPVWEGKELAIAIGSIRRRGDQTHAAFSVLNRSQRTIELLPPQIVLVGKTVDGKHIKSEPVAISIFQLTSRQLAPGQRVDGVVLFARPSFKQSSEHLELMIAKADQIDRPIGLPIEFTTQTNEVEDEPY
jgi:hypothetical protein